MIEQYLDWAVGPTLWPALVLFAAFLAPIAAMFLCIWKLGAFERGGRP